MVGSKRFRIINTYINIDKLIKETDWEFLGKLIEKDNAPILFVGDFNARSWSWGNINENKLSIK